MSISENIAAIRQQIALAAERSGLTYVHELQGMHGGRQ